MSQFYSDLLNWTAVAVCGGAIALSNVDLSATPAVPAPDAGEALASATTASGGAASTIVTSRAADVPTVVVRADAGARIEPQQVRRAELKSVRFTSNGQERDRVVPRAPNRPEGVVTASAVNLRSGPGTGNPVVGRATQNERLPVTGESDGVWVQVIVAGGQRAWVHGRYFDVPDNTALN